ncbi:MAG: TIGR04086 family membrane protein [Ignavibacteriales bacterium]
MKKYNDKMVAEGGNSILSILKGVGLSYIMTLAIFLIVALFLCFTEFPETMIGSAVVVTTIISIMFGGTCVARKARTHGWLNGAIAGLTYMVILYVLSSFTGKGFGISQYIIIMMLVGIAAGAVGGIVGINLKKR